jgi:hypothetical protein
MTELLSLNEDETAHCYTCNRDSALARINVRSWREIGSSLVAAVACPACGRHGELHIDRGGRAGTIDLRAFELLQGHRESSAA